jgi:hypothetical protein
MCNRYKYADDVYHRVCNKVFSGVRVTRSLVLCFVNRCLSILFWSLYCLVIFRFWLPLWYLQALLMGILLFMLSNYMSAVFRSVYIFPRKNDVRFIFTCVVGGSCFMLFVLYVAVQHDFHVIWGPGWFNAICIVCSCPTRLPCHMRARVVQCYLYCM